MKSNRLLGSFVLSAAMALAIPVLAKPVSKTINITQAAKLGKADLLAGEYRLLIDGNKATVQKGRSVVAESEGRWEERDTKTINITQAAKLGKADLLAGENRLL